MAGDTASNGRLSAAGTALRSAGPVRTVQPETAGRPGSGTRPFPKKIPLHRQFSDLGIQQRQSCLVRRSRARDVSRAPGKQRWHAVQRSLLPGMDLARMDRLDSSATVPSSRSADSATLALKSTPSRSKPFIGAGGWTMRLSNLPRRIWPIPRQGCSSSLCRSIPASWSGDYNRRWRN
jgi:hypothetical protein